MQELDSPAELATGSVILTQGHLLVIEVHGEQGFTIFETLDEVRVGAQDAVCGALRSLGAPSLYIEHSLEPIGGSVVLVGADLPMVLRLLGERQQRPALAASVQLLTDQLFAELRSRIQQAYTLTSLEQLERGIWFTYDAHPENQDALMLLRESIAAKRTELEGVRRRGEF